MKTVRFLALLLALLMAGSIAFAETTDDPIVIKVDDQTVPLSVIQSVFDAAYEENKGATMTQAVVDGALAELIEQYVQALVIENKIAELGFDQITEEDEQKLRDDIAANYDADIEGYAEFYGLTVDEARQIYEMNGLTQEGIFEMNLPYLPYARLQDYATEGITVTDEEATKEYNEEYVPKDKELYGSDVASYESTVYFYGRNSVFYIPDGYRYVKHIKLALPEDVAAEINDLNSDISIARNAISSFESELYLLENTPDENTGTTETDTPERTEAMIQADLDAQQAKLEELESRLDEAYEQVMPSLLPTTEEITKKLSEGTSFDALIDEYSIDESSNTDSKGELIHKESTAVDAVRRDAAMALSKVGDVSEPIVSEDGVYILQYEGEAGGPVELTQEVLDIVRDSLLSNRKEEAFAAAYAEWADAATIETHPELVVLPQIDSSATGEDVTGMESTPVDTTDVNEDGSVG